MRGRRARHRIAGGRSLIAILSASILALACSALPASAASGSAHVDDEVSRLLQATPESGRIPVIIEGASDVTSSADRAARTESHVRNGGGLLRGSSVLLGDTVAELTPAQLRTLASDPAIGRIHLDAPDR